MVRPEDRANLLKVFQINTCLWGGLFNPIIPFFKRVPAWWERNGIKFDNATQIVNGYLDYFEPDFVVEAENGIARGFGIDPERILQLPDVLARDDQREARGHGQSVLDLYRKLYKEEFQFVRRHKHRIVGVKADAPYDAFAACLFGAFPKPQNLKYFAAAFKDTSDPRQVTLDPVTLDKLYKSHSTSPLHIGCHGLDVDYNDHSDPALFVLDAQEPKDLLDFWNYRATHRTVAAIPVQWLPQLSECCKKVLTIVFSPAIPPA